MDLNELEHEFVVDHTQTTRALNDLKSALETDDLRLIKATAKDLDQIAGPHIAFEELWLYPMVAKSRGADFAEQLLGEHGQVHQALTEILSPDTVSISDDQRSTWQNEVQTGLDHVVTCGTLLSHLSELKDSEQQQMLARLKDLRNQNILWTNFSTADH